MDDQNACKMELRLAGSGGQGLILASIILAEAALMAGKNVAQTQSYGAEARGGVCKAEVVISDFKIGFFKVRTPTFLLALTQQSLSKYTSGIGEACIVMTDETLDVPGYISPLQVVSLPILRTAAETVGKSLTANIVAVGAINKLLRIAPEEVLKEAVGKNIPEGTQEINFKALRTGAALI